VKVTLRGESGVIQIPVGNHVVSREPGAAVSVPHPGVSRRHATLDVSRERVLVTDSGSANGTFVNGQRIAGPSELEDGDSLAFGHVSFMVAIRRGTVAIRRGP